MEDAWLQPLKEGARALGIPLDQEALRLFSLYQQELLLWNRRINLVSEKSSREIAIRHFLDSLTVLPWIERPKNRPSTWEAGLVSPESPWPSCGRSST
jgi:16S rRNA (guanine527-N7)-methyltransferase